MSDVKLKYKQYIIVIKSLCEKVSRAKFGVHCAHASLKASLSRDIESTRFIEWEVNQSQVKIVKEVKSLEKLKNIINKAKEKRLPCGIVPDAGFTEELGAGEIIMGAVGPITEEEAQELGIWRLSNYKG